MIIAALFAIQPACTSDQNCNTTIESCMQGFCRCKSVFMFGEECKMQVDDCNAEKCGGNGQCDYKTSECLCSDNFDPESACASCITDFVKVGDYCYSKLCVNPVNQSALCSQRGKCIENARCECTSGYAGLYCEFKQEECDSKCEPNEECDESETCVCKPNFLAPDCAVCEDGYVRFGDLCVVNGSVADNSSLCSDRGAYYDGKCQCEQGFYGAACEMTENECALQVCGGFGKCQTSTGVLDCVCDGNRAGKLCSECQAGYGKLESGACLVESCLYGGFECANYGKCTESKCVCLENRIGAKCEMTVEECGRENCNAQGVCKVGDQNQFFSCTCYKDRGGSACEDCAPDRLFKGLCWPTMTVGIVGGVVGGVLLIVVVIVLVACCCRRRLLVRTAIRRSIGVGSTLARSGAQQGVAAALW